MSTRQASRVVAFSVLIDEWMTDTNIVDLRELWFLIEPAGPANYVLQGTHSERLVKCSKVATKQFTTSSR
jgi:hypothetical protein